MLVGLLTVPLPACDPYTGDEATAVSLGSESQSVDVLYRPCQGELVQDVRVVEMRNGVVGGAEDPVIWQISSRFGSSLSRFRVGETADGFEEIQTMRRPLDPAIQYAAILQTTIDSHTFESFTVFRIQDIQPGKVLWKEQSITLDEFVREARKTCP